MLQSSLFVYVGPPLYTPITKKLFGGGSPSHSKARASEDRAAWTSNSKARAYDAADTASKTSSNSKAWASEDKAAQPFQNGAQSEDWAVRAAQTSPIRSY